MPHPRIKRDPKVMMGKPVVAGTRITVAHVLRCLAAGDSVEHILSNYPHLTLDDLRAAQAYAADYLAHEGIAARYDRANCFSIRAKADNLRQ